MLRQFFFFLLLILIGGVLTLAPVGETQAAFHSEEEHAYFKELFSMPPVDTNLIFPPASSCRGCHGFDSLGFASIDYYGNDVNVFDDWEATMMANSAKDPFWRAKVSHEVLVNPEHQAEIETKCTACHAPMGHYTEILRGADHYLISDMLQDTIGLEGVSCGACHMISEENLGFQFSGKLSFDTSRVLFGPYQVPFAAPMMQFVGYDPIYSPHINDAGICAGCHSLINTVLDLDGNPTGETFVEQATYHEWLNSIYDADNISCQGCHMPQIDGPVIISSGYSFLTGRTPFGLHEMVGANTMMLGLMKENKEALGITALDENYDETIAKTLEMLQVQSVNVELNFLEINNDTAFFEVFVLNKAGHKFPSGYPSRRAFIEFLLLTEDGDTLFHSGKLQPDYEVAHLDPEMEPHYEIVRAEEEVQIYETVIADVSGSFTTILERGAITLKDNRLPPQGFTTSHPAYDTTQIAGGALTDSDFNYENGEEGSGSDRIQYHIGLNGYSGFVEVQARMHYQSLPPRWLAPMLAESTPEIDAFRQMFEAADKSTVIVGDESITDLLLENTVQVSAGLLPSTAISIFPNPVESGTALNIEVKNSELSGLSFNLWNSNGQLIRSFQNAAPVWLNTPGIYLLEVEADQGRWLERIIVY